MIKTSANHASYRRSVTIEKSVMVADIIMTKKLEKYLANDRTKLKQNESMDERKTLMRFYCRYVGMEHYEGGGMMRKLSGLTGVSLLLKLALLSVLRGCGPSRHIPKSKSDLENLRDIRVHNTCTGASMTVGETAQTLSHLLKENPTTRVYQYDLCSLDPAQYRQRKASDNNDFGRLEAVYGTNNMYYMLHKDTCLVPSMASICDSMRIMPPGTPGLQELKCFCTVNMMTTIAANGNLTPIDFGYQYPTNIWFNMDNGSGEERFQGIQETEYFQTTTTTYRGDEVTIGNPTISPDDYAALAQQAQQSSIDALEFSGTTISLAHDIQCPVHISFQPIMTSDQSHGVDPLSYSYNLPPASQYTIMNSGDAANATGALQDMFQAIKTNTLLPTNSHINIAISYHTETGVSGSTRIFVQ